MNDDATEAALALLGLSPNNLVASSSSNQLKRKLSTFVGDPTDHNSDSINCICGFSYDDGFSIACDDCSRWCHAACFDIVQGQVPEEWRCWVCVPRAVDREKAARLQRSRQRLPQGGQAQQSQRASPGVERKHRRISGPAVENGTKRKRRASINVPQVNEDDYVDMDEPWTHSYVPISQDIIPQLETRNKLHQQARDWRGVSALEPSEFPYSSSVVPVLLPEDVPVNSSATTIRQLPSSTFSHPTFYNHTNASVRPPSYSMHTTSDIPSAHLITPYKSTIIPSATYLSDPLNAYAHLGMPKPFVHLLGPPLDIALDSRITGNEGRFARSGCRPNAVLRPVLCSRAKASGKVKSSEDDSQSDPETLTFGVFALRDLKANEEVVLGWEWDDGCVIHRLPALIESPHTFPSQHMQHLRVQMISMLHALSSTFTTCACGAKARDCALTRLAAFVDGSLTEPPPPLHTPDDFAADVESKEPNGTGRDWVDLGPLIGVGRGFRTKEKVPWSGGMGGVEMIPTPQHYQPRVSGAGPSTSSHHNNDQLTTSSYALQSQALGSLAGSNMSSNRHGKTGLRGRRPQSDRKGKGKASEVDDEHMRGIELDDNNEEFSGSQRENTSEGRRPPADFRPAQFSSSSQQHPHLSGPGPGSFDEDNLEDDEDRMPPKLRKRWIHHSLEILRATYPMVLDTPDDDSGGEIMDVDTSTESKLMPPPSVPPPSNSSLLPPHLITSGPQSSGPPQQSPSTAFASLSLTSPTSPTPYPSSREPSSRPSLHALSSPSTRNGFLQDMHAVGAHDLPKAELDHADDNAMKDSTHAEDVQPNPAPHSSSEHTGDGQFVSKVPDQLPYSTDLSRGASVNQPLPSEARQHLSNDSVRPDYGTVQLQNTSDPPRSDTVATLPPKLLTPSVNPPVPASAPAPPQKVKLSLKDFATRRKKEREEAMARASESKTTNPTPPINADQRSEDGMHFSPAPVVPSGEKGRDSVHREPRFLPPPRDYPPSAEVVKGSGSSRVVKRYKEERESSNAGGRSVKSYLPFQTTSNDVRCRTPSPLPGPQTPPRRPSQEEGEIPVTPPSRPPIPPRSHTPPTQPRSFMGSPNSLPYRTPMTNSALGSRPVPSGPRALRGASAASGPGYTSNRASTMLPRGPSTDRERMDWERDRERTWSPRDRGRGRGGWAR